ncbi:aldo/keto reductase [Bacillus sp. X1(2014)]|uniref:aldo/keto reductase n=1 Tax=Bacillus sp. X1(2014) TaxID=1565991 RepID=UPI0011A699C2|nr:aldo/keto reductase [Bacillus sp. X1(2014)]
MKKRKLGKSGLEVSAIGLGCMGMDHAYGKPADRDDMIKLILRSVELGCNFFDTAVVYGESNEELLGQALAPVREEVVIATKFGITGQEMVNGLPQNILDSYPESIKEQLEGSLKRLKVDCIDLYYQHRMDPNVEPEAVAETMKQLMAEGKIKAWGLSNAPIDYMKCAHAVCPIAAIENQYSMMWREPENELFDICEELGISFVAYSPLGNGFLSGKFTKDTTYEEGDFRSFMGRFKPEVIDHNQALLELIAEVAKGKNASNAQVALAWELAQKPFIIPIPGTRKLHRIEENLGGAAIELTKEELDRLNIALSKIDIDETHF